VRTAAGLLLILFAAAFTFTPAADAPRLSVERSTYEVPIPGAEVAVRFTLGPPLGQGRDHVIICHNQHTSTARSSTATAAALRRTQTAQPSRTAMARRS
jgi:hypothetical protein